MKSDLLNTADAASFLGMSKAFLERDRWAGARIPFVKIGARTIRYRREDLMRYIEDQMRRSTSDMGVAHAG